MIKLMRTYTGELRKCDIWAENGSFSSVYAQDQLVKCYDPEELFLKAAKVADTDGYFVLEENIAGAEDAWMNTLIFTANPEHTRFYTPAEIINAALNNFVLSEFFQTTNKLTYECRAIENASEQIAGMPQHIRQALNPQLAGAELTLNVPRGLFVFKSTTSNP